MELKRIMIIDDDEDDRLFFQDAVKKIDPSAQCIEAENGAVGLSALKEMHTLPQYIFLDLNMPVMNGVSFLKEITRNNNLKNIPVIVYTTSVSPDDMKITSELGARYYLPKTADLKKLPTKIAFAITMVNSLTVNNG